jgi:hypothetical protein
MKCVEFVQRDTPSRSFMRNCESRQIFSRIHLSIVGGAEDGKDKGDADD